MRYICSADIPAGAGGGSGSGAAATTAAGGAAPVGCRLGRAGRGRPGGRAVGARAATAAGAGGRSASATISSMARSMGIRTLLLVAGLTQPYDVSSVFPWSRSSSAFLASAF